MSMKIVQSQKEASNSKHTRIIEANHFRQFISRPIHVSFLKQTTEWISQVQNSINHRDTWHDEPRFWFWYLQWDGSLCEKIMISGAAFVSPHAHERKSTNTYNTSLRCNGSTLNTASSRDKKDRLEVSASIISPPDPSIKTDHHHHDDDTKWCLCSASPQRANQGNSAIDLNIFSHA